MAFKDMLRRLERRAEEDILLIPQQDGTVAKFSRAAYRDAFLCTMARVRGGADVPPRHPLLEAARNSSDPRWRESYFSDIDYVGVTKPVEDLSEA